MNGMRSLLTLFLVFLAAPAFAQTTAVQSDPTRVQFLDQKYWSELGKPVEGPRGFSVFTRNMQPKSDSRFEVWVKIVPNNQEAFNKRYDLPRDSAYVVQYATVDCSGRTVQLERTTAYDRLNGTRDARYSELSKNETRSRVKVGSISDTIFQYICLKLPS